MCPVFKLAKSGSKICLILTEIEYIRFLDMLNLTVHLDLDVGPRYQIDQNRGLSNFVRFLKKNTKFL